jgi:hypothetical protein
VTKSNILYFWASSRRRTAGVVQGWFEFVRLKMVDGARKR